MSQRPFRRQYSLDRFIRRRSTLNFELLNEDVSPIQEKNSTELGYFFTNIAKEKYHRENYQNALKIVLLKTPNISMGSFTEILRKKTSDDLPITQHWPVEARTKPLLPPEPYLMLDLPDLHCDLLKNVVDWGNNGYIATIYNNSVYFWNPDNKEGFKFTYLLVKHCIKWNHYGTYLGMSVFDGRLAVYDFPKRKVVKVTPSCPCLKDMLTPREYCSIVSIEWTKSDHIITGCSKGTLTHWSSNFKVLNFRIRAHYSHIMKISLSCEETYLVTSGKDKVVMVWTFPWLELVQDMIFSVPTKAIAWHPWKDSLLVVGDISIFWLINVQNHKVIKSPFYKGYYIYTLIFNPKSAELLVSLCDSKGTSYLKILKNMNVVTDEVRCNEGEILYLVWDKTGTKLGTASTDENFCIWNFFGKSTDLEKKHLKNPKHVLSKNPFKNLNILSYTIR